MDEQHYIILTPLHNEYNVALRPGGVTFFQTWMRNWNFNNTVSCLWSRVALNEFSFALATLFCYTGKPIIRSPLRSHSDVSIWKKLIPSMVALIKFYSRLSINQNSFLLFFRWALVCRLIRVNQGELRFYFCLHIVQCIITWYTIIFSLPCFGFLNFIMWKCFNCKIITACY